MTTTTRSTTLGLATLAALAALLALSALVTSADARVPEDRSRETAVVKRQVSFTVDNVNRSALACPTDGRRYTIRGQITGPRGGVHDAETVALYLHGLELGSFFWTLEARGASFVERQARDGHVSVVIDRLGYDASGKPDGTLSCLGGQADIANQIVDDLRSGHYRVRGGAAAPTFTKVVLGGHSVGGQLAELAAISFDNADGIVVASYSDTVFSDGLLAAAGINAAACAAGGQRTEGVDLPGGYAPLAPSVAIFTTEARDLEAALSRQPRRGGREDRSRVRGERLALARPGGLRPRPHGRRRERRSAKRSPDSPVGPRGHDGTPSATASSPRRAQSPPGGAAAVWRAP